MLPDSNPENTDSPGTRSPFLSAPRNKTHFLSFGRFACFCLSKLTPLHQRSLWDSIFGSTSPVSQLPELKRNKKNRNPGIGFSALFYRFCVEKFLTLLMFCVESSLLLLCIVCVKKARKQQSSYV